jgi:hypothetical protein
MPRFSTAILAACLVTAGSHAFGKSIDISSFGAVSGDGRDDAGAINSAIRSAAAGDTVVIPSGIFDVSTTINTRSGVNVSGTSRDASVLRYTGTASLPVMSVEGVSKVSLGNFAIDANNNASATQGIYAGSASQLNLHDLKLSNFSSASGFGPHAIYFASSVTDSTIANNTIKNIGTASEWGAGIRVGQGSSRNQVLNNSIDQTGRGGILVDDNSTDVVIRNNTVTHSGGMGLGIEVWGNSDRAIVEDNHIDHWLSVDSSNNLAVRRNVISDKSGTYKYTGLELVDAHDDVFTDNIVDGGQQLGISISGPNPKQRIYWGHNTIKGASTWGVQIQGETGKASQQYFYKNEFENTARDLPSTLYAPQGHGVRFNGDASDVVFDSNTIANNQGAGVEIGGSSLSDLKFVGNTIASNAGGAVDNGSVDQVEWSDNTLTGNSSNTIPKSTAELDGPIADATTPSIDAKVGEPVAFSIKLAPGSPSLANVLWDFGDGLPSTELAPSHTYETAGTYRVAMIGWDSAGDASVDETLVNVGSTVPEPAGLTLLLAAAGWTAGRRRRSAA